MAASDYATYSDSEASSWGNENAAEPIRLPRALRGYVRYVVVLHPEDFKPYSIGVKYVCNTEGAQGLLAYLMRNVNRKHKKHVHSWLCQSSIDGTRCELEDQCPNIHVTRQGYESRRCWLRPLKGARTNDGSEELEGLGEQDEADSRSMTMTESPALTPESLSPPCSTPCISRPPSPRLQEFGEPSSLEHAISPLALSQKDSFRASGLQTSAQFQPKTEQTSSSQGSSFRSWSGLSQRTQQDSYVSHWDSLPCQEVAAYPSLQLHEDHSGSFGSYGEHGDLTMQPYDAALSWQHPSWAPVPKPAFHDRIDFTTSTDPRVRELTERQERLEKTRAKLHNTVDWILSNDRTKWTDLTTLTMANV